MSSVFHAQIKQDAVHDLNKIAEAAIALQTLDYMADVVLNESFCYAVQRCLPKLNGAQLAQVGPGVRFQ